MSEPRCTGACTGKDCELRRTCWHYRRPRNLLLQAMQPPRGPCDHFMPLAAKGKPGGP